MTNPRKRSSRKPRRSGSSRQFSFSSNQIQPINLKSQFEFTTNFFLFGTSLAVLLVFAGRTPPGQFVLFAGTTLTAFTFFLGKGLTGGRSWKWTGLEPIFFLSIALISAQLVPLPEPILETLSPAIKTLLEPAMEQGKSLGTFQVTKWNRLSLSPRETKLALISFVCVTILFLIMVQQFQNRKQARQIILTVALFSAGYALYGILQKEFGNSHFFWFYAHPHCGTLTAAKGSFTNSNHFAGFLALSIGPILGWTLCTPSKQLTQKDSWNQTGSFEWRPLVGGIALSLLLLGIGLTSSRGGLLLAGTGIGITLLCIVLKKMANSQFPIILSIGALTSLIGIAFFADQSFEQKVEEIRSANIDQLDQGNARRFIWASNINAFNHFPWTGTGLGTHEEIIPTFHVGYANGMNYTHAENSYLQIGTETGMPGWILFGAALLLVLGKLITTLRKSSPQRSDTPFYVGIAGTICAFIVHGTYDFAWYAPAYLLLFGVYVAFLFSHSHSTEIKKEENKPRRIYLLFAGISLIAAGIAFNTIWSAANAHESEYQYVRLLNRQNHCETDEQEWQLLQMRIKSLKHALKADPTRAENHLRMAKSLRQAYELKLKESKQSMPVSQIRSAVYSGGFESQEQLQTWLNTPGVMNEILPIVKASLHFSKQSLKLSPLKSNAHLIISELCFIESPDSEKAQEHLEKAKLAEPFGPNVYFVAGLQAWGNGEVEVALSQWNVPFLQDRQSRKNMIIIISQTLPADFFVESFSPELKQLEEIVNAYGPMNVPRGQSAVLLFVRNTLEQLPEMTHSQKEEALLKAYDYLGKTELVDQMKTFIALSEEALPNSGPLKYRFAHWFMWHKEFKLAYPHLKFCSEHLASDPKITKLLEQCESQLNLNREISVRPTRYLR